MSESSGDLLPHPGTAHSRNPMSRARFERIAGRTVSAFGLVFGLQTILPALGQLHSVREPWGLFVVILVFAGLAAIPVLAVTDTASGLPAYFLRRAAMIARSKRDLPVPAIKCMSILKRKCHQSSICRRIDKTRAYNTHRRFR